jgi:hypothetical protein
LDHPEYEHWSREPEPGLTFLMEVEEHSRCLEQAAQYIRPEKLRRFIINTRI